MKKTGMLLFYIVVLNISPALSQVLMPGGVAGAKIWYTSFSQNNESIVWKNMLIPSQASLTNPSPDNKKGCLLNYNPALHIDGRINQNFHVSTGQIDLSKVTVFTVYDPQDAYWEKAIWAYSNNGSDQLVLTTHRVADLENMAYMNFVSRKN